MQTSTSSNAPTSMATVYPLSTVLERLANLEKTVGHMLADNDGKIYGFITGSETPIALA